MLSLSTWRSGEEDVGLLQRADIRRSISRLRPVWSMVSTFLAFYIPSWRPPVVSDMRLALALLLALSINNIFQHRLHFRYLYVNEVDRVVSALPYVVASFRGMVSVIFGIRLPFNVTGKRPPPEGTIELLPLLVWGPMVALVLAASVASAGHALSYATTGVLPSVSIRVAMVENAMWIALLWNFLPCLLPGVLQRYDARITRHIASLPKRPATWADYDYPSRSPLPSLLYYCAVWCSSVYFLLHHGVLPSLP